MKKILGLALGTSSIGWAVVNEADNDKEKSSIIQLGVRINPLTVDEQQNFEKGRSITTNADRALKRGLRRNLQRYKSRRTNLIEVLKEYDIISDETILSENGNKTTFETYRLRAQAATGEISLEQFARVLLMINKKRGYKSSRKVKRADEGALIDGMGVAKKLYDENLTPGQLCLQLLQADKKSLPDFYRSDLQAEFDKVFDKQLTFYPDYLSIELKEELRNKKRDAVWVICNKAFKEKGVKLVGIKRYGNPAEQNIENYAWRVKGLTEKLSIEQLVIVLQQINIQINNSSGYLGAISDRSKELYFNKQTVGQYQMTVLEGNPNASLRNMVFYRQDYLDEFNTIWETQAQFHKELTEELKHEIRDVVIFYQRRMKSHKWLVGFCEFESRKIEVELAGKRRMKTIGCRAIPRSSPLFQEFKVWQTLNNLEISTRDGKRELDQCEKELLAKLLAVKEKLTKPEVLKLLLDNPRGFDLNFKEVHGNTTQANLLQACPKIAKLSEDELHGLWHLLYSFEGDNSKTGNGKLIKKLARSFGQEYAVKLVNVAFPDGYANLSAKAIRKILPYLKEGNKYDVACEYAGYKCSKSSLTKEEIEKKAYKKRLDILPKNSLRSPVVEKILNQMVNVINAIIDTHGKPDEIRIELARELKKNAKEREGLVKALADATKAHDKYKEILSQPPFNLSYISHNDIIRYKLYAELKDNGYRTLYSNTYISPTALFCGDFDTEHIIPKARFFDDSSSNKTLELRSINGEKKNMTAYDFVKRKYGERGLEKYLYRIDTLFRQGAISRAKYDKLKRDEQNIPEGFLNRDLGDTRYIARYAKTMLGDLVPRVVSTTSSVTIALRKDWQLVDVMKELNWDKYDRLGLTYYEENREGKLLGRIKDWTKRNDHRHRAVDALIVAFTKAPFIQLFNNLNASLTPNSNAFALKALYIENGKVKPPMPLSEFRVEAKKHLENTLVSVKAKNKVVTQHINITKKSSGMNEKPQKTPRGQLHNETIYGSLKQYDVKEKKGVKTVTFKTVYTIRKEVTPDLKIDKVIDAGVKRILQARLDAFGGDAKKAFINLEENPIWLNQEKGISIKRVTVSGINKAESLHYKRNKEGLPILDEDGNKQPVDFVNTANNHHVAIYRVPVQDKNGKMEYELQENIVSFYEAVARRNAGLPIIDKKYKADEHWEFLFSMKQNEYFVFPKIQKREKTDKETGEITIEEIVTFDPKEIDLLDPENYSRISPNLFRVRKFTRNDYHLVHHLETVANDSIEKNKTLRNITWIATSKHHIANIVKVRINHIGQIVSVGEQ